MISVFGASVTQQKTGYVKTLQELYSEPVESFGFGGMHLNDAGICFVDKALSNMPKVCLIDWFSTDYNECDSTTYQYIDAIIFKCRRFNTIPVFLFFPHKSRFNKEKFYDFCKLYLNKLSIPFIDVQKSLIDIDIDIDNVLRDSIHTSEYGSKLYGQIILEYLESGDIYDDSGYIPEFNIFCNIKEFYVNKEFSHEINLIGNCKIIGFYIITGPFIDELVIDDQRITIKDRWSYYTRDCFKLQLELVESSTIMVFKRNSFFSRNRLVVKSIFYCGGDFHLKNIDDGDEIMYFKFKLINVISRFKSFFRNYF